MAYLEKEDYTLKISLTNLDQILNQIVRTSTEGTTATEALTRAERFAKNDIRSYLNDTHEIDEEFAKNYDDATDTRSTVIMECLIDITLCKLHATINPHDIPELRKRECDRAIKLLAKARKGEADILVDKLPDAVNYQTVMSNIKFRSKPFRDASLRYPSAYE